MEKHAFFSPSKLETILECPGSVMLEKALLTSEKLRPEPASEAAEHGTMLHDYVRTCLTVSKDCLNELTLADRAHVLDALDYLEILIASLGHKNYELIVEEQVSLKAYGLPEVWGTADIQLLDNVKRRLHIIDWKFGSGIAVYAKENPQLMSYGAGGCADKYVEDVRLHVVQPPKENYTQWDISYYDLFQWVHGTLAVVVGKCKAGDVEFFPGETQCRWCPVKNHCDARFAWAQKHAQELFEARKLLPNKITPESIHDLLTKAPLVEQVIKDLKLYVSREIQHGVDFPGYKLVRGRANRKWKSEDEVLKFFDNDEYAVDDLFVSKLISPAQAEKLNKKLKKNEDFQKLYEKPEGKLTLVPQSDPREAADFKTKAVDIFADYAVPDKLE
jgi:hypothetical protein